MLPVERIHCKIHFGVIVQISWYEVFPRRLNKVGSIQHLNTINTENIIPLLLNETISESNREDDIDTVIQQLKAQMSILTYIRRVNYVIKLVQLFGILSSVSEGCGKNVTHTDKYLTKTLFPYCMIVYYEMLSIFLP